MHQDDGEILQTETQLTTPSDDAPPTDLRVPALTLLAHPDPRRVGELVTLPELPSGQAVSLSRSEPTFAFPGSPRTPLAVAHLSRRPIRLVPGPVKGEVTIDRAGSRTPVKIDDQSLSRRRMFDARQLERGVVVLLGRRIVLLLHYHHPISIDVPPFGLIGESTPMVRLRQKVQLVAELDVPVLLRGESGTGKELLVHAIHRASTRRKRPYIAVNMAAIPVSLAASELFGAMRGAYTGAERDKKGLFQRADGGTLFLDEIGETPSEIQPLLLRALDNGEIQPVGSAKPRRVDVRVIAATDADLEALTGDGRFRAPLLHRLAGYEIRVPPLRERRSDFGRLFYTFLRQELDTLGLPDALDAPGLSGRPFPPADLVARLALHDWPGNVRELKNTARRLAIAHRSGGSLEIGELVSRVPRPPAPAEPSVPAPSVPAPEGASPPVERWRPAYRSMSEVSEDELLAALRTHRFALKPTAEALGVSRGALYDRIEVCPRIRRAADLEPSEIEDALEETAGDLDAAAMVLEVSLLGLKHRMKALGMSRAAE